MVFTDAYSIAVVLTGDAEHFVGGRARLIVPVGELDLQSAGIRRCQPVEILVANPEVRSILYVTETATVLVPRSIEVDRVALAALDAKPWTLCDVDRLVRRRRRTEDVVDRVDQTDA